MHSLVTAHPHRNFGSIVAQYLGVCLLNILGGVEAPEFVNIEWLVFIRCCAKLLPIVLVLLLVPRGSPRDSAFSRARAARANNVAVAGSEDESA